MRTIKFRVWNKKEKRMFPVKELFDDGFVLPRGQGLHNVFPPSEIELMQFTGLKDKNGKEIWEGDIVEKYNSRYEVKMDDVFVTTDPGSGYEGVYGWGAFDRYDEGEPLDDEFEVIGNIYEGVHSGENNDIITEWNKGIEKQSQKLSKDIRLVKKQKEKLV